MLPELRILFLMDPSTSGALELMRGFNAVAQVRGWEVYRPGRTEYVPSEGFVPHGLAIGPGVSPAAISQWNGPVVSMALDLSACGIPSVDSDDFAVGALAATHLRHTGIGRFAYFGEVHSAWSRLRMEGFRRELAKINRPCALWTEHPGNAVQENWSAPSIAHWIESLEKPVAIFAGCDIWARTLLRGCRTAGVRVPEQVSVLGVDNYEFECSMANPPLSSIDIAWRRIGEEAALQLDRAISGKAQPNERMLLPPIGVVTRASTDLVSVDDPNVSAALRFIRQNADKPISVADILKEVSTFQHNLERGFRKYVGRTMLAEIRRVRVERAQRLLSTTTLSIESVAHHCGFPNATKLGIAFRRETSFTPGAYRKRHRNG